MHPVLTEKTVENLQHQASVDARRARLVRAVRAERRARRAVGSARIAAERAVVGVVAHAR